MGRPRLPTAIINNSSTGKQNPGRTAAMRQDELQVTAPLGKCPAHLEAEEKLAWAELVQRAAPGVLKAGDEFVVELAACLIAERRVKRHAFSKAGQLVSVLRDLGLTPAGRSMVKDPNAGKEKPKSGFGLLRARSQGAVQ